MKLTPDNLEEVLRKNEFEKLKPELTKENFHYVKDKNDYDDWTVSKITELGDRDYLENRYITQYYARNRTIDKNITTTEFNLFAQFLIDVVGIKI